MLTMQPFKKKRTTVKSALNEIKSFSNFSWLQLNLEDKCEIAGIGILKNVYVALCGMKNINLTKESIKNLGVHITRKFKMNWTSVKLSKSYVVL